MTCCVDRTDVVDSSVMVYREMCSSGSVGNYNSRISQLRNVVEFPDLRENGKRVSWRPGTRLLFYGL